MTWEVGSILNIVSILLVVVVVAAMLIWVERRLLGIWQERLGPNRVGPLGLLQVVADGGAGRGPELGLGVAEEGGGAGVPGGGG